MGGSARDHRGDCADCLRRVFEMKHKPLVMNGLDVGPISFMNDVIDFLKDSFLSGYEDE